MKKKIGMITVFAAACVLSACGGKQSGTEVITPTTVVQPTKAVQPTEEAQPTKALSEELPAAYQELLHRYETAVYEGWSAALLSAQELNYMMADIPSGYLMKDFDGDGKQELLIGADKEQTDDFYGKLVFTLYRLDEAGQAVKVFDSGERNRYYYAGGSRFANVGANSASDSVDTTLVYEQGALRDLGTQTEPTAYEQLELTRLERPQLTLPILGEIRCTVTTGTAGSSLVAVQAAVKLLDWGTFTGLGADEIKEAAIQWVNRLDAEERTQFFAQMELVDSTYRSLLQDGMEGLLASAGCEDAAYPWSSVPVESIEAIMEAVGLR